MNKYGAKNEVLQGVSEYAGPMPRGPKVVYDLAKAGIIERGAGQLYALEDSVRRWCDHFEQVFANVR